MSFWAFAQTKSADTSDIPDLEQMIKPLIKTFSTVEMDLKYYKDINRYVPIYSTIQRLI